MDYGPSKAHRDVEMAQAEFKLDTLVLSQGKWCRQLMRTPGKIRLSVVESVLS